MWDAAIHDPKPQFTFNAQLTGQHVLSHMTANPRLHSMHSLQGSIYYLTRLQTLGYIQYPSYRAPFIISHDHQPQATFNAQLTGQHLLSHTTPNTRLHSMHSLQGSIYYLTWPPTPGYIQCPAYRAAFIISHDHQPQVTFNAQLTGHMIPTPRLQYNYYASRPTMYYVTWPNPSQLTWLSDFHVFGVFSRHIDN